MNLAVAIITATGALKLKRASFRETSEGVEIGQPALPAAAQTRLLAKIRRHQVIDHETGCHIWGGKLDDGYARIYVSERGGNARVHRLVYELLKGAIPTGLVIDHLCGNRACSNVEHLEAVTDRQNVLRGTAPAAINARKVRCKRGHPLSGDNDYGYPHRGRECKTCSREASAARRALVRAGLYVPAPPKQAKVAGRPGRVKTPITQRLARRVEVDPETGCHNWQGARRAGYGSITSEDGKTVFVHRVAYELAKGSIPAGLVLDHLCRNRRCCNPDHLEAVTFRENVLRGNGATARNARKDRCSRGHPLDGWYPSIGRFCSVCRRDYRARQAARVRETLLLTFEEARRFAQEIEEQGNE